LIRNSRILKNLSWPNKYIGSTMIVKKPYVSCTLLRALISLRGGFSKNLCIDKIFLRESNRFVVFNRNQYV